MNMAQDRSARLARWGTALVCLLCTVMMFYIWRYYISTMNFRDPDDALRLVEVRDWLAGQSWFDVTQYRSHPPMGAPMHWSRLVDVPLGLFTRFFGLFTNPGTAEWLALATVPLTTLAGLFATLHALTLRVTGKPAAAVFASVMLATSVGVLVQVQPMRIDHHGWQILLGLLAVWLAIARRGGPAWNCGLAGLVMAVSLTIAIESLPLAVGLGGVLGLRYLRRADAFGGLFSYVLLLGAGATLLLPAMLGWHGAQVPWCDAMSPAYALPLLLVALLIGVGRALPQRAFWQRLTTLSVAGAAGALLLAAATPQCLAGPFATLDPLVYRLWYTAIMEGMPIWKQSLDLQIVVPLPSLLGLLGTLLAIRFDGVERRGLWIEMLLLQILTFAVSMLVMRAMGLAHVLAIPGNAWLILPLLKAAQRLRTPVARVLAGVACFIPTPLGLEMLGTAFLAPAEGKATAGQAEGAQDTCVARRDFEQLNRLPPTEILTPLDLASHMLVYTHHSVVATGHHRNVEGMKTVISFFIADPAKARAIIAATPARYVGFCPGANEVKRYAKLYPNGLMAALVKDRPPTWLRRIPMERKDDIRFYQLVK